MGGIYHHDQGKYKEGEKYYLKAVNIVKQIHEEKSHPDVASSYNNLGNHYNFQAVEMFIKSLNLRLELYGKDNPHSPSDYKRAEEYYKKALNIRKQIHEEKNHPDIALRYNNLGLIYYSQGDIIRTEEMLTKALEQRLRIFGNNIPHEEIAYSYNIIINKWVIMREPFNI